MTRVATPRTHHPDSKKTVEVLVTQHLDCVVDVRVVLQSRVPTRCFRRCADVHRRVKKASEPCNGQLSRAGNVKGHHTSQSQLPCGRDVGPLSKNSCRARLCLLVAVARLAGRWCLWRLLVFLAGLWVSGCSVSLSEGADPRTGVRGLASRKECRLVSRCSCPVQNIF